MSQGVQGKAAGVVRRRVTKPVGDPTMTEFVERNCPEHPRKAKKNRYDVELTEQDPSRSLKIFIRF